eukprot:267177-Amphidinium_carterae.3
MLSLSVSTQSATSTSDNTTAVHPLRAPHKVEDEIKYHLCNCGALQHQAEPLRAVHGIVAAQVLKPSPWPFLPFPCLHSARKSSHFVLWYSVTDSFCRLVYVCFIIVVLTSPRATSQYASSLCVLGEHGILDIVLTFVTRPIYRRLHGLYRVRVSVSRPTCSCSKSRLLLFALRCVDCTSLFNRHAFLHARHANCDKKTHGARRFKRAPATKTASGGTPGPRARTRTRLALPAHISASRSTKHQARAHGRKFVATSNDQAHQSQEIFDPKPDQDKEELATSFAMETNNEQIVTASAAVKGGDSRRPD